MENFLPVLLILGAAIYKIYTAYKEEQEKARKRQPRVPVPASVPPPPVQKKPIPSLPTLAKKAPEPVLVKTEQKDFYPEEVAKVKEQKKLHKEILAAAQKKQAKETAPVSFDLRQAVIQSVILERPYK